MTRCTFLPLLLLGTQMACSEEDNSPPGFSPSDIVVQDRWVSPSFLPGGMAGAGGAGAVARSFVYPPGPYGTNNPEIGEVVQDLVFEGYASPWPGSLANQAKYETVSLSDLRKGPEKYLLVHVAAFWCSPCLIAAEELNAANDTVLAAGARSIEVLIDGRASGVDPTRNELDLWVETASLTIPTLLAGRESTRNVFPNKEHAYIIELDTMMVVWRADGFYKNTTITAEAVKAVLAADKADQQD